MCMSELIFVPQNNYFAGIGKHFNKNLENIFTGRKSPVQELLSCPTLSVLKTNVPWHFTTQLIHLI